MKYFNNSELRLEGASEEIKKNMHLLVDNLLDPLRQKVGAIRIDSAYRSVEYNKKVGGAIRSQHCLGEAVDIVPLKTDIKLVFKTIIKEFDFDQLIFEKNDKGSVWIHVSYKAKGNRKEILIANKVNNKWIYTKY